MGENEMGVNEEEVNEEEVNEVVVSQRDEHEDPFRLTQNLLVLWGSSILDLSFYFKRYSLMNNV